MATRLTIAWAVSLAAAIVTPLAAQPPRPGAKAAPKPFQAQSSSSVAFRVENGEETIEISNVVYELVGSGIPGRPPDERLMLRKTTHTSKSVDDIGMEASTLVEAWPLGVDPKQKPLYSMSVSGVDCNTINNEILVVLRGLEEVEWWSVHKLATGERLFDTYVPLVQFSISRDTQKLRYVGLDAPGDDTSDARLKDPHVVAVLTYASAERVIREALITCDDPKQATLLRSFADAARTVTVVETGESARSLRISISQNYPSPPATATVTIPIARDDLDVAHVQAPARLHVAAWKR